MLAAVASCLNCGDAEDRPLSKNCSCLNVADLENCGPPGLGDCLDGALRRRQKGGQLRGEDDQRRKEGFGGFISFSSSYRRELRSLGQELQHCVHSLLPHSPDVSHLLIPWPLQIPWELFKFPSSGGISRNMSTEHSVVLSRDWTKETGKERLLGEKPDFPSLSIQQPRVWPREGLSLCWWELWDRKLQCHGAGFFARRA